LIHRILSPLGLGVWIVTLCWAAKLVADNADIAFDSAQAVLASDNLFLLYLGLIFVKAFHELGHAAVCHRYGGEVHTMGLMFMIFTPLPYMDATSSWGFRSRWQRAFVGAAGMLAELFVASLAAIYWAVSGTGALHSLAYNIMFVASVSTLLFNANPLLRLDGYYILSDLLDIPNLHIRSTEHLKYLLEHFLFKYSGARPSAKNRREMIELSLYGVLSSIYKVIIFLGITLFVADKWLILGTLLAIVGVVTGVLLQNV
jgi:putative peptide zinc metalloprotease protein